MEDLKNPRYTPASFLDRMAEKVAVRNDAQLAAAIGIAAARLSRIRNRSLPVSPGLLIRLNEMTGITIGNLRQMMGMPSRMYVTRYITR